MRILLIGNDLVVPALRALGHEVVVAMDEHPTLAVPMSPFDVRPLWEALPWTPDLLLVIDALGGQMLPDGLEYVPVPRVYYAIDVHLNFFWQRHYATLFDLVLVTQKDFVPLFEAAGVPAHWLPWGADARIFHDRGLPRVHDVAFVGVVDPGNRPKRAAAVDILQRRFGMATFGTTGATRLSHEETAHVHASAKIVFNEAVLGDVNFRVFEAMGCGALLLTEQVGNGLTDLFIPGVHLDVYTPDTLVARVEHWLRAGDERARVAAAGAALVHARHTLIARMAELTALVERGIPRRTPARPRAAWGTAAALAVARGLAHAAATAQPAGTALRAAVDGERDAGAAVALAEMLAWAAQPGAALDVLAEARRLDPTEVRGWLVAGELALRRGDEAAAAQLLRAGVDAAPDPTPATRARARAAIAGGVGSAACRHALGLVLFESGLPFLPGFVPIIDAGVPRTALDYFTAALSVDPTYRPAADDAAHLLELGGLPDFAVRFAEVAVRTAPRDPDARATLARLLRKCHRADDAVGHERARAELLADEALARIGTGDWAGARARLEDAGAVDGAHVAALVELLHLVREAEGRGAPSPEQAVTPARAATPPA